jgi:putative ABC transport system permease protein
VRDWHDYVRTHLRLSGVTPEREVHIVRELAAQLEDFYRDALARGHSERDADAYAVAQITDWARMAEDVRRADRAHAAPRLDRLTSALEALPPSQPQRGLALMLTHFLRDARYAIRQLIKAPGFTTVAIITLALGVGTTTAIFSVVNGVLLRPLPYPEPQSLLRVHELVPNYGRFSVAPATFLDWRQQNSVFERLAAYQGVGGTFTDVEGPARIQGAAVSWDIFELLRVAPARGTGFTADQDRPKANNVIVLSHGLWQRRFGGDPNIVGTSVSLSGVPVTIVGVMPPDFYFPSRTAEYWRPIALNPANASRGGHFLCVIGRAKPGVDIARAATEMKAISERLALQYPDSSAKESAEVVSLHEQVVGGIRPALLTLLAAVGVVVLIACANVANLLLVRASVREKEVAIRTALGAGRRRLVMQMLAESLVLAVTGGALGLFLAYLALTPIQTLSAGSIPRVADITIDRMVLLFALGVSVLTGVLFGLAPAWHASRAGVGAVLKEGGRSSVGTGGRWVRATLLVVEMALSIVLLVGAALLLRSFAKLTNVNPGFEADRVLAFQVALPQGAYPEDSNRVAFFDRLLERLTATPGVRSAGMVQTLPMRGDYVLSFDVQGRPPAKPGEEPSANHRVVNPDYFQTLGIPLKRGRLLAKTDIETTKFVALIDDAFVHRHFVNEDPIGRQIKIGNGAPPYEVVGIVGDVHYGGLDSTATPTMYVPFKQDVFSQMWMLVRSDGDPAQLGNVVRQAVHEVDPTLPAFGMSPLATVVSDTVAQRRFSMLLLALFAGVALFLAAVGLYGVVSYTVSQRTREIGLRLAIGAAPGDVLKMVVGGGMKLAIIGVVLGLAGALALTGLIAKLLFDVTPFDPASYAVTALLLLAVAALACYLPARRAMRVDPIVALQQE